MARVVRISIGVVTPCTLTKEIGANEHDLHISSSVILTLKPVLDIPLSSGDMYCYLIEQFICLDFSNPYRQDIV